MSNPGPIIEARDFRAASQPIATQGRSHRYYALFRLVGFPVGAGMPAKQATRWLAPATPVFAGAPAPTGIAHSFGGGVPCGSGFTREAGDAVVGTGYAQLPEQESGCRQGCGCVQ
ncbi:protein of unknown function [Pseudomonas sp. JV551A1]|uniref:Uncharacterized protein n=1 Tax=Pseudomonas inefficax TaxID=2078786 RepID=A0AAQ1PBS0_9PSED|nr:protein of unknown function [Pseudomonas sp. JV551A1]SPO61416.1 protein of unknown function [Pseudomonas inefficax]